ncbi:MAG: chemotaxis protein [Gammaproteobacteria bacterium]|nr:chemotaxis protein [Gammaproteobacteria bacterium]
METFIKSVDERTKLAGANRLEVLLFSLGFDKNIGREEVFGINVFKVREVMHAPVITHAPDMPPSVEGLVSLRGVMVPVINVAKFCGMNVEDKAGILIVTEYNRQTQGLLVHSVEHILRMEWSEIKVPPPMLAHRMGGLVTAVTELQDKRIVMVLDVERILAEAASHGSDIDEFRDIEELQKHFTILYADDSSMARKQIEKTLDKLGVKYVAARNGKEAWAKISEIAAEAAASGGKFTDRIQAILTDVEMPEMDGYVLTRKIKNDPRTQTVPVLMHSSLSADANVAMGKNVGADIYVPKFDPKELAAAIKPLLEK